MTVEGTKELIAHLEKRAIAEAKERLNYDHPLTVAAEELCLKAEREGYVDLGSELTIWTEQMEETGETVFFYGKSKKHQTQQSFKRDEEESKRGRPPHGIVGRVADILAMSTTTREPYLQSHSTFKEVTFRKSELAPNPVLPNTGNAGNPKVSLILWIMKRILNGTASESSKYDLRNDITQAIRGINHDLKGSEHPDERVIDWWQWRRMKAIYQTMNDIAWWDIRRKKAPERLIFWARMWTVPVTLLGLVSALFWWNTDCEIQPLSWQELFLVFGPSAYLWTDILNRIGILLREIERVVLALPVLPRPLYRFGIDIGMILRSRTFGYRVGIQLLFWVGLTGLWMAKCGI